MWELLCNVFKLAIEGSWYVLEEFEHWNKGRY